MVRSSTSLLNGIFLFNLVQRKNKDGAESFLSLSLCFKRIYSARLYWEIKRQSINLEVTLNLSRYN